MSTFLVSVWIVLSFPELGTPGEERTERRRGRAGLSCVLLIRHLGEMFGRHGVQGSGIT